MLPGKETTKVNYIIILPHGISESYGISLQQMYCSERCRQEAFDLYHRIECKMLVIFNSVLHKWPQLKEDPLLVLRLFLIGTKQGSELTKLMNDPNVYDSLEGKRSIVGVPYPADYLSFLNLIWKRDDDSTQDVNEKYEIVGFMFNWLKRFDVFGEASHRPKVSLQLICVYYKYYRAIQQR